MWFENCVFYQIYPLGFCGAGQTNESQVQAHAIKKVTEWIPHMQKLGIGAVLFNPVFESDTHGYDTRDYTSVDRRLGTKEDFAEVCAALHKANIKVVLDGVFNHVGRGFWAFKDVQQNRENSPYKDWFVLDFNRNSNYDDGFWYEGWEGHYELVKLNLQYFPVVEYLISCIDGWIRDYGIDGLRLDVAYCLDKGFIQHLRHFADSKGQDLFLVGEMLHGDYKSIAGPGLLHSATNYECYKGLYSSFNSNNMFEIAYSLNRQFGPEDWTLYKGLPLFSFVDNHDVTRIASILQDKAHLPLVYGLLFGMPGIPCIYYGSEWGAEGEKQEGSDAPLRPAFEQPIENALFEEVRAMCHIRTHNKTLGYGSYRQVYLTNNQLIFERKYEGERVLVAINAESAEHVAHFNAEAGRAKDLLHGSDVDFGGGLRMPGYSVMYLEMEH